MEPAAYLLGTWAVERALHDAALGAGAFTGTAAFVRRGPEIAWEERGRLRLGGYQGPGARTLRLVPEADGWVVRFADGRPFHPLELSAGRWRVRHPCGQDVYDGEYTVLGPDAFDVAWTVRGPAKDQRISSRYRRR